MLATTDLPKLKQKPKIKKRRNKGIEDHAFTKKRDPIIDLLPLPYKYSHSTQVFIDKLKTRPLNQD